MITKENYYDNRDPSAVQALNNFLSFIIIKIVLLFIFFNKHYSSHCVYIFVISCFNVIHFIKSKMTALHLGVSGRHVDTVKKLSSNADPSAINAVDSVSVYNCIAILVIHSM